MLARRILATTALSGLLAAPVAASTVSETLFRFEPGQYASGTLFLTDEQLAGVGLPDQNTTLASDNKLPDAAKNLAINSDPLVSRFDAPAGSPLVGDIFFFTIADSLAIDIGSTSKLVQLDILGPDGNKLVPTIDISGLFPNRRVVRTEDTHPPSGNTEPCFGFGFGGQPVGGCPGSGGGGTGVSAVGAGVPDQTDQCFGGGTDGIFCSWEGYFIIPDMEITSIVMEYDARFVNNPLFFRAAFGSFELYDLGDDAQAYFDSVINGTAGLPQVGDQPEVIPLPAGIWLLLSGVAGFAFVRRHQSGSSAARV